MESAPIAIKGKEDEKKGKPDQWEIDSWIRTLTEAEEIKSDPKKMKYVQPALNKKVKAIMSLADLKAKGAEMEAEDDEDEEYES
jgi:hypothetical protein